MTNDSQHHDARPFFRWLAGITCPVFLFMAIVAAFPNLFGTGESPSYLGAALFLWGAGFFGTIAAKGRYDSVHAQRVQIFVAAKKYAAGQITLDEYGAQTKQILGA